MTRLMEALDDARAYRTSKNAYGRNAMRKLVTGRLDLEALQAVNARRQSLMVGVNRASDILAVLGFAKKARIDVVLTGVAEGWLVADAIAAARVPVVVNALANLPRRFESKNSRADNAVLMARAGVKVAIATASAHNVSGLRFALGNAVRAGLPRDLALKAATLHPAEIFRMARKYGSIERGRVANLVVWTGDPFEPSSAAEHVIIRGQVQSTENRQTRLRDRYKARLGL
jgi:imidazolonepropionase-like amidohydrolase